MPGQMMPPTYSPARVDDVEGGGGAEVDDDHRRAEALARRDRVDDAVGPHLGGVVVADGHAGLALPGSMKSGFLPK